MYFAYSLTAAVLHIHKLTACKINLAKTQPEQNAKFTYIVNFLKFVLVGIFIVNNLCSIFAKIFRIENK